MGDTFDQQPNQAQNEPVSAPVPTAPAISLHNGQTAEQWFKSYTGSQSALRAKQTELEKALAELATLRTDFENFKVAQQSTYESVVKDRDSLLKAKSEYESKYIKLEREAKVRTMIETDYPNLATNWRDPIWRAGALAAAETMAEDALKAFLGQSAQTVQAQTQTTLMTTLQGTTPTPPAPTNTQPPTAEDLAKKLMSLRVGTPEYQQTLDAMLQNAKSEPPKPIQRQF